MAGYDRPKPGQWVRPKRKWYRMMCCDCGLVHALDFRLVNEGGRGYRIEFRAVRDQRSTGQARRWMKVGR